MKLNKVVLAVVPAAVVAGVSLASAASLNLAARLDADLSVPQGSVSYDCSEPAGHRGHIQAMAEALDSCGNRLGNGGRTVVTAQNGEGSSQGITFESAYYPGPCGQAARHRAWLQKHIIDQSNGTDTVTNYDTTSTAVPSGCWNVPNCTAGGKIWSINSSVGSNTGACAVRRFQATSLGSTN